MGGVRRGVQEMGCGGRSREGEVWVSGAEEEWRWSEGVISLLTEAKQICTMHRSVPPVLCFVYNILLIIYLHC